MPHSSPGKVQGCTYRDDAHSMSLHLRRKRLFLDTLPLQSVFRWFNYRVPSFKEGAKAEAALGNLMEEVCGIQKKTRMCALTALQLWSKDNWDNHRDDFDRWFDAQELSDHTRSAEHGKYTIQRFQELPKEEREAYECRASDAREVKTKGKQKGKGKSLRPEEDVEDGEDDNGDGASSSEVMVGSASMGPEGRLSLSDLQT